MPNMVKESDTSAALLARDEILRDPSIQECRSESTVVNIMKKPVDADVGTMQFQFKTRLKLNLSNSSLHASGEFCHLPLAFCKQFEPRLRPAECLS